MQRHSEVADPKDLISTYRYLRLGMLVLAALLATSVVLQVADGRSGCWLPSISAYYYTAARAVFVACLCAIGTCLIVYRGTTPREDVVLDVSGTLAFFVAFIPTPLEGRATGSRAARCGRSNVPSREQLAAALDNNVWSALVALCLVALLILALRVLLPAGPQRPSTAKTVITSTLAVLFTVTCAVAPDWVQREGHYVAAGGFFAGIALVVAMNGWPGFAGLTGLGAVPRASRRATWVYRLVLVGMALALVVTLVARQLGLDTWVFWLETAFIVLFAAYWAAQTWENWEPGA